MNIQFPVGGSRQRVYDYLRNRGFIMSNWSDKHWERADGLHVHVYGTGSRARCLKDGKVIADGPLDEAVEEARTTTAKARGEA